jgi:hypothetical protein
VRGALQRRAEAESGPASINDDRDITGQELERCGALVKALQKHVSLG